MARLPAKDANLGPKRAKVDIQSVMGFRIRIKLEPYSLVMML